MDEEQARAVQVTEADRIAARAPFERQTRAFILGGIVLVAVISLGGAALVEWLVPDTSGWQAVAWYGGIQIGVLLPLLIVICVIATNQGAEANAAIYARERHVEETAERHEFEGRLRRAFEMTHEEPDTLRVLERALRDILPDRPAELLLADNSHAHLQRVATHEPEGEPPGCPVDSPERCPAARHTQSMVFPDSDALDACPHLADRAVGRIAAVCVPVSMRGETVGAIHVTAPLGALPNLTVRNELQALADASGVRMGLLRLMDDRKTQAEHDSLTGLLNRRSLEEHLRQLWRQGLPFSLVMADLDHFKMLNDTHGHETGDRALRSFAQTLKEKVRPDDLVCRWGGEEFTIVMPGTHVNEAMEVTERIRDALAVLVAVGDSPPFTVSFGVSQSDASADIEDVIRRADHALYEAKGTGRNRTVRAQVGVGGPTDGAA